MGANVIRMGLMVQRDRVVDAPPLAIEPKAALSSSCLDCNELNS